MKYDLDRLNNLCSYLLEAGFNLQPANNNPVGNPNANNNPVGNPNANAPTINLAQNKKGTYVPVGSQPSNQANGSSSTKDYISKMAKNVITNVGSQIGAKLTAIAKDLMVLGLKTLPGILPMMGPSAMAFSAFLSEPIAKGIEQSMNDGISYMKSNLVGKKGQLPLSPSNRVRLGKGSHIYNAFVKMGYIPTFVFTVGNDSAFTLAKTSSPDSPFEGGDGKPQIYIMCHELVDIAKDELLAEGAVMAELLYLRDTCKFSEIIF